MKHVRLMLIELIDIWSIFAETALISQQQLTKNLQYLLNTLIISSFIYLPFFCSPLKFYFFIRKQMNIFRRNSSTYKSSYSVYLAKVYKEEDHSNELHPQWVRFSFSVAL